MPFSPLRNVQTRWSCLEIHSDCATPIVAGQGSFKVGSLRVSLRDYPKENLPRGGVRRERCVVFTVSMLIGIAAAVFSRY